MAKTQKHEETDTKLPVFEVARTDNPVDNGVAIYCDGRLIFAAKMPVFEAMFEVMQDFHYDAASTNPTPAPG